MITREPDPAVVEAAQATLRMNALRSAALRAGLILPEGTYCHYGKGKVVYRVTDVRPHGHDDDWAIQITPEPGQHPKNPFWTDLASITVIDPPKKGKK